MDVLHTQIGQQTITMTTGVYIGLAVTSHNDATLTTASTVWTILNAVSRASSPQMFQMRVPHTHTVQIENAYRTMA